MKHGALIWSSPKGKTGEAAAMRPSSLRHRHTETCWPSLKWTTHDWMLSIRAGARQSCIEVESRQTPIKVVCWAGVSTLFWPFSRRPSARRWRRRESLWRITCSLELAKISQWRPGNGGRESENCSLSMASSPASELQAAAADSR